MNISDLENKMIEGPLVLVSAADDAYAMPLAVMLYSALKNYTGAWPVDVFILDAGISTNNQQKIRRVLRQFNIHLNWCAPDPAPLYGLPTIAHLNIAAYYRLLIPETLPQHIEKALYLDADMLVMGDIDALWQKDFEENILLAASDGDSFLNCSPTMGHLINVIESDPYFNSGVMLLNLEKFRNERLAKRVIDLSRKQPELVLYADQCGLNAVCIRRWGVLDKAWNYQAWFLDAEQISDVKYIQPNIFHFTSDVKPWLVDRRHWDSLSAVGYFTKLWDDCLFESGWITRRELKKNSLFRAEERITELEGAVAAREAELELNQTRIEELQGTVAFREAEVAAIRARTSWRFTAPARAALGCLLSTARLLRKLFKRSWWTGTLPRLREHQRRQEEVSLIAGSGLFDAAWYLKQYPDVAEARLDPLVHFVAHGASEGRDPNPLFDTYYYLEANPDVAAASVNPLSHYLQHGAAEGRKTRPDERSAKIDIFPYFHR